MNTQELKFFVGGILTALLAYVIIEHLQDRRANGSSILIAPQSSNKACSCSGQKGCGCDTNYQEPLPNHWADDYSYQTQNQFISPTQFY